MIEETHVPAPVKCSESASCANIPVKCESHNSKCQKTLCKEKTIFCPTHCPNCYYVTINSTGPAKTHQPSSMGTYVRSHGMSNRFPVYKKVDGPELLCVGGNGYWYVSTLSATNDYEMILRNKINNPTPAMPPPSGWLCWYDGDFRPDISCQLGI